MSDVPGGEDPDLDDTSYVDSYEDVSLFTLSEDSENTLLDAKQSARSCGPRSRAIRSE